MAYAVKIKPLSVNECWQGRRYKTEKYIAFEEELLLKLPKIDIPRDYLELSIEFGLSNICADWDNPIKPFVDVLQKAYGFNDRYIMKATVTKKKCNKGAEYIIFDIKPYI